MSNFPLFPFVGEGQKETFYTQFTSFITSFSSLVAEMESLPLEVLESRSGTAEPVDLEDEDQLPLPQDFYRSDTNNSYRRIGQE